MLMAFVWWAILLYGKNQQVFQAKKEILELRQELERRPALTYENTPEFEAIVSEQKRQNRMVFSEVFVFCLALIIGIYLINRAHQREMQTANQQKNFLLSITHELKSPIASIKLVLETFIKRELSAAQINRLSNNALKETERLNTLVNDLLLAAKVETAYTPHLETIHLKQFLGEIIERLQNKYPIVGFGFRKPDQEIIIQGDKTGLTSVAVNLLENAVKYGAENPKISIVLRQDEKSNIQLEFADNGIGIPEKEKRKIFERFYRVGNEDTRKTKGTGLGLYIVNQIVLAHKGTIEVLNNRPKGTIFSISLPANDG